MYSIKSKYLTFILLSLFFTPVISHAETSFNLSINYGNAVIDVENDSFNDGSLGNTMKTDPDSNAWGVTGEMSFNRFVRMEFGIIDGDYASMNATSNGLGSYWWFGPVTAEYGLGAIKVGAIGVLPFGSGDQFKLIGKLGLANWFSIVTLDNFYYNDSEVDTGLSPYYGIGAEVDLSDLISLRLQHEEFSASASSDYFPAGYEFDYKNTTLGLLFRF